jgi:hypothetical protein
MGLSGRLFLFFFLLYTFLGSREPPWADAHVVYDTTQALVDRGALDIHTAGGSPTFYCFKDGKKYGVFPVGNVVGLLPGYLIYKLVHKLESIPDKPLFAFTCHIGPSLMGAALCAVFFILCRRRGASERWALLLTLALGLGTSAFIYARSPFAEAAQTVCLVWLVERAVAMAEAPTLSGLGWMGFAAGALINTKLVYALCVPPAALYVMWMQRSALRTLLARSWLGLFAFAELMFLIAAHNKLKTGDWLSSGYFYKEGTFSGDLLPALYGFTLSTGKSALLYSPPLLLGILGLRTAWRERRAETLTLLSMIVVMTLVNAKFRFWHGDYAWGPRYLTPIQPLVLLLALPWLARLFEKGRATLRRFFLGALLGAGLYVQLIGAVFYWDHYIRALIAEKDQTGAAGWFTENLSHGHYIPEFSPIRGHLWLLSHLVRRDPQLWRDAPWNAVMPLPADQTDVWGRLRPDWWALGWGESSPLGAALLGALLASALTGSALGLRRRPERR